MLIKTLNSILIMQLKDMAGMLKQVQEMSKKMEEVQRELAKKDGNGRRRWRHGKSNRKRKA